MAITNQNTNTKGSRITILLSEERRLVREAWSFILNKESRFRVIAECDRPESALLQAKNLCPDIILMEIRPPGLSGIEMLQLFEKFSPQSKILTVSMYSFPGVAGELIQAGASGFLTKTSSLKELFEAIIQIREGKNYVCREIEKTGYNELKPSCELENKLSLLSIREIEILTAEKNGLSSMEIGKQLNITEKTVDRHRCHMLKSLELNYISELIHLFEKHKKHI
jgi:two-component system invasion response regulator UvrY